jgi:hypothetical protein
MVAFLDRYTYPGQTEENELVVKMFRHTLMHTGELRFVAWPTKGYVYTWTVMFGEEWGTSAHYRIDDVDPQGQDQLLSLAAWIRPALVAPKTRCLHIILKFLARDVERAASEFLKDVHHSPRLQVQIVDVYKKLRCSLFS